MADYRKIARHHPEVRDYIRLRKWVYRGETVSYGPNIESETLSTDRTGYRNSVWKGRRHTLADCIESGRYGLVMGPSNVYGFGVPSDAHTIPSRVGEMLGVPFANIGLPEGHTRNLFAILLNLCTRAKHKPSAVLLLSGGDFTGWAYSGIADPVFGPPNILQLKHAAAELNGRTDPVASLQPMLAASRLWTVAIAQLCRSQNIALVFGNDTTFFEKRERDAYDLDCRLGEAGGAGQKLQFEIHRKLGGRFYAQRAQLSERLDVPLAGPGPSNQIGFVDEFHYDAAGTDALCAAFAPAIEAALKSRG